MRVKLKGLNSKHHRLASGETVTYYYAWRGGPRLHGKLGSAEFIASYNEAVSRKRPAPAGTMLSILQAYQNSGEFLNLRDRTRADYVKLIILIEKTFADFPLAALDDRRSRGEFLAWRDEIVKRSLRQADYA